jgi:hypothetical protein
MRLRLARPEDLAELGRLLPHGLEYPLQSQYALLEETRSGALLGAVCLIRESARALFFLKLVDSCPAEEGTQSLVQGAVALARLARQHTLRLAGAIPVQSLIAAALERAGFVQVGGLTHYEMDLTRRRSTALTARLRQRGRLPESVRVLPVREVTAMALVHFLHGFFGLRNLPDGLLPECSFALLDGNEVTGALLATLKGEQIGVPHFAVEESRRDGYAAPLLMAAFTEAALAAGHSTVVFMTDEVAFPGFARIAQRMGAVAKAQFGSYELLLQPLA